MAQSRGADPPALVIGMIGLRQAVRPFGRAAALLERGPRQIMQTDYPVPQPPTEPPAPDAGLPLQAADLSLIVPFRCDDPARLENLRTVLRIMGRMLGGAEIIVIEDSAEPVAGDLCTGAGVRYAA